MSTDSQAVIKFVQSRGAEVSEDDAKIFLLAKRIVAEEETANPYDLTLAKLVLSRFADWLSHPDKNGPISFSGLALQSRHEEEFEELTGNG